GHAAPAQGFHDDEQLHDRGDGGRECRSLFAARVHRSRAHISRRAGRARRSARRRETPAEGPHFGAAEGLRNRHRGARHRDDLEGRARDGLTMAPTTGTETAAERLVSAVLRGGVFAAATVTAAGGLLYLAGHGSEQVAYGTFNGEPAGLRSLSGILI